MGVNTNCSIDLRPTRVARSLLYQACAVFFLLMTTQAFAADPLDAPYPEEVSLIESDTGWTYRQSADGLPLYVFDKDRPGKSACDNGCDLQWIPLLASRKSSPRGDWSLIPRKGHKRQWAYRGRPVYMHIHDSAEKPLGDGQDGVWHLLPVTKK